MIRTRAANPPASSWRAGPTLVRGPWPSGVSDFAPSTTTCGGRSSASRAGSDVLVGALLCPPVDPACVAGVIFFNNVGYLGMCGHGTIGVAVTLGHLGRIAAGRHLLETPVGRIAFDYDGRHTVTLENVPSYRLAANVTVSVAGVGNVTGDVAWGGNWFFLVREHREVLELAHAARLVSLTQRIKTALQQQGITGADGAEIDHIELFGPPRDPRNHSRNFVLCPGGAYDRSPCGTGTERQDRLPGRGRPAEPRRAVAAGEHSRQRV